ncbi:MAG: glycosyl hydrolase family 57 [Candidatus Eremiobacteraeota bacterium]|nr:glycosyl hydrolase family 57 [Candidatus Eremiobacteraeota bacterium]
MMEKIQEIIEGLPNICGAEKEVEEVTARRGPVFLHGTNLRLEKLEAVFAIALHMHQPLIPAGGADLQSADLISNLDVMMHSNDSYNAGVFADCYGRMGDIIPELVREGRNPRVMLDYSGELLFGLRKMGRSDVLERLRGITCDPALRNYAEWLGTMWGHSVVPTTPVPDIKLHIRAWQQNFAAIYGWEALERVKGFSPPEMHLPNHPDVACEFIKALRESGYRWLLVQEHTVEAQGGHGLQDRHIPHRLVAKNSCGEEASIIAIIKTQGSDTKLVAQMQPYYEALTLKRQTVGGISIPPIVTQIGDGENGGVMMNEFPPCYRQTVGRFGTEGVVSVSVTEYLEMLEKAGVTERELAPLQPIHQEQVFRRITKWEPGAADNAIAEIRRENQGFAMEGGSWTNNISWVRGYENVLTPMNALSAQFHEALDHRDIDRGSHAYRNALFHLLVSQTSCFRYWGQGMWTDYAREICRRGSAIVSELASTL